MHFGDLAFIRGIVYYRLSHHEMKAYAGWAQGAANFAPRALHRLWTYLPTWILTVWIYKSVEHAHWLSLRKDPSLYVDEVDPNPPAICQRAKEAPGKVIDDSKCIEKERERERKAKEEQEKLAQKKK